MKKNKTQKGKGKKKPVVMPIRWMKTACVWHGCEETTPTVNPSPDWKYLMVTSKSFFDEDFDFDAFVVDSLLCPKHFKELYDLLKMGRMKKIKEEVVELRP